MTMLCFILTQLISLHSISPHVQSQLSFYFVWANQFILPIQLLHPPNLFIRILSREALKLTSHFYLRLPVLHLLQFPTCLISSVNAKQTLVKQKKVWSRVCIKWKPGLVNAIHSFTFYTLSYEFSVSSKTNCQYTSITLYFSSKRSGTNKNLTVVCRLVF